MGPPEAVGPRKKSGVSAPVCGPAIGVVDIFVVVVIVARGLGFLMAFFF